MTGSTGMHPGSCHCLKLPLSTSNFANALPYDVGSLADTAYPYLYGLPCTGCKKVSGHLQGALQRGDHQPMLKETAFSPLDLGSTQGGSTSVASMTDAHGL